MSSLSSSNSAIDYAQRIWDQDDTVYNDLDHIVKWIGDGKPTSNTILSCYMAHFDFKDLYLEQAFRNLCSKLSLRGESQQIDRILLQFSQRYFECNPRCIFGTPG
jgi:Sec7-like guanine-nucleotide exchange factor